MTDEQEEMVTLHPVPCDGCGKVLAFSDDEVILQVLVCTHCCDHPEGIEARLGDRPT